MSFSHMGISASFLETTLSVTLPICTVLGHAYRQSWWHEWAKFHCLDSPHGNAAFSVVRMSKKLDFCTPMRSHILKWFSTDRIVP